MRFFYKWEEERCDVLYADTATTCIIWTLLWFLFFFSFLYFLITILFKIILLRCTVVLLLYIILPGECLPQLYRRTMDLFILGGKHSRPCTE